MWVIKLLNDACPYCENVKKKKEDHYPCVHVGNKTHECCQQYCPIRQGK